MPNPDTQTDKTIREGLKSVKAKGKLDVLAMIACNPGGEARLQEIIDTDQPLDSVERSILSMHL